MTRKVQVYCIGYHIEIAAEKPNAGEILVINSYPWAVDEVRQCFDTKTNEYKVEVFVKPHLADRRFVLDVFKKTGWNMKIIDHRNRLRKFTA